ncbi:MAG: hypothetical protein R2725_08370 [Solirubrobacterales bacterium]
MLELAVSMFGQGATRTFRRSTLPVLCGALTLLASLSITAAAEAAKKGGKGAAVSLSAPGSKVASGKALRLEGAVGTWAKGQRVLLLVKPAGTEKWSRAGATKLRKNKRFSFEVKPPLGKTAYRAIAQRRGGKAPKAVSRALRLLGLPGASSTIAVVAGGRVTIGGLLPTPVKRRVVLQKRGGGKWKAASSKRSTRQGRVSFGVRVTTAASYRLYAPKHEAQPTGKKGKGKASSSKATTRTYGPFTSPPVQVRIGAVTLSMPDDACINQKVDTTVQVSPAAAGSAVEVQVSEDGGVSWAAAGTGKQGKSGAAAVSFVAPPSPGTYHYRAVAGSASPATEVEVRPCAGFPPLPQIYGGGNHSCEIDVFGEAWCWGSNKYGQLGDGSFEDRLKPVRVTGGHAFVDMALGSDHTCGLTAAGKTYCWGSNENAGGSYYAGAVGDGSTTDRSAPAAVSGGHSFVKLAAGAGHSCGLTAAGSAYCWGNNGYGQLGQGDEPKSVTDHRTTPVRVGGGGFSDIAATSYTNCGIAGGRAYCWGIARLGYYRETSPATVPGSSSLVSVVATAGGGCGLNAAGSAYCWGRSGDGQLGRDTGSTTYVEAAGAVSGGHSFSALSAGNRHVCGIAQAGPTYCWGYNNFGPLGRGSSDLAAHPTPEEVSGAHSFTRLGLGSGHSCAIDNGSVAWCWGINNLGQLGVGTAGFEESRYVPNTPLFP